MHSKANIKIHNRFDIEVIRDGEIIQRGQAENIVLDRIYTRLCNYSSYFVNIVYGSGTGTLDPTRTTLFTRIASAAATTVETIKAYPVSKWTRRITLGLTTSNNQWIREVGISNDTTSINTHALITDINGDPLEIYKTDLDIIYIYATVFIELQNKDENNFFVSLPNSNLLLNYLVGGTAPTPAIITDAHESDKNLMFQLASLSPTKTVDVPNKKIIYTRNFTTSASNGAVKALVLDNIYKANLFASSICETFDIENIQLGIADGIENKFLLKHPREVTSLVIRKDGVVVDNENYVVENNESSSNVLMSLLTFVDGETIPTTKMPGFDGTFRNQSKPSGSSSETNITLKLSHPIIGKTFYLQVGYVSGSTYFTHSVTLFGSNDNINFTTLVTVSSYGNASNTTTWLANANYEYLKVRFRSSGTVSAGVSKGRVSIFDSIQQITFNSPPGLVENEDLGLSDRIKTLFALANNPLVTVQGDPEGDPPTENEYALTVKFDDVVVSPGEYTVGDKEIVFIIPPGIMPYEELGIGDGSNDTFTFKFTPDTINGIYIDSVLVDPLDYTITGDEIVFNTPPALDEVVTADYEYSCAITADYRYEVEITADYTVPYIPKTEDNVLDVSMEITFGPQEEE